MKPVVHSIQFVAFSLSLLGSTVSFATLDKSAPRGEQKIEIAVPGRASELCVIPKHVDGVKYSKGDLKTEKELCELDVYTNTAVCPKINSTNPGLDLFLPPKNMTIAQVEDAKCETPDSNKTKKVAKYKLSTSCSYTPSILGYYHVSRMLGDVLEVPPSVVRTFDLKRHLELGKLADKRVKDGALIDQTWSGLVSQLSAGANGKKKDQLLTSDLDQSYGALSDNPRDEEKYSEMFNGGADNVARAATFKSKNPTYLAVAKRAALTSIVGTEFNQDNVQKLVQMRDVSNMVIMDTLLNQQDRFGNIHVVEKYAYKSGEVDKKGLAKIELEKKLKDEEIANFKPVKVKVMMLKDNDCGVSKENIAEGAKLLEGIAHIAPKTYKRVLKLNSIADRDDVKSFFMNEVLMTAGDYKEFRDNLTKVAATLKKACEAKTLTLDLDLENHFGGVAPEQECDLKDKEN